MTHSRLKCTHGSAEVDEEGSTRSLGKARSTSRSTLAVISVFFYIKISRFYVNSIVLTDGSSTRGLGKLRPTSRSTLAVISDLLLFYLSFLSKLNCSETTSDFFTLKNKIWLFLNQKTIFEPESRFSGSF